MHNLASCIKMKYLTSMSFQDLQSQQWPNVYIKLSAWFSPFLSSFLSSNKIVNLNWNIGNCFFLFAKTNISTLRLLFFSHFLSWFHLQNHEWWKMQTPLISTPTRARQNSKKSGKTIGRRPIKQIKE